MSATDPTMDEALADLAGRSEVLAGLIARHGPYEPRRAADPNVFQSLAKAIVHQQLAGKAAASIHGRFIALVEGPVEVDLGDHALERKRLGGLGPRGVSVGGEAPPLVSLSSRC